MATAVKEAGSAQVPVQRRSTEIDTVRMALDKLRPQLQMALPRHLTVDRLLRVAMTAVQNTPKLLECDRRSLFGAIMTCAQLGLEPDGVLGQAYLVPFAGKVQFIPGYKGLIALARNSGDVSSIAAHEVRANDAFVFDLASGDLPSHKFGLNAERGEVIAFYAIARFRDGGHHWDVMSRVEVEGIRDRSQGWRAYQRGLEKFKAGKQQYEPSAPPWLTDFVEMGKKTVIRRIAKYLPMSVQKAAALSDAYDLGRHAQLGEAGEVVIDAAATDAEDIGQIEKPKGSKLDRFEDDPEIVVKDKPAPDADPTPAAKDAANGAAGADKAPAGPADWTEYEERMFDEITAAAVHGSDVVDKVLAREAAQMVAAPADTVTRIRQHAQKAKRER